MICVSNSISSRLIASHSDIDLVIVQLLTSPCVILCCVYIPPNCSSSYFCSAISILETILTQHNHVIILGDFNLPDINWSSLTSPSPSSTILCDLIFKFNLIQMVNNATHSKGNILDLILTNIDYLISNILVTPTVVQTNCYLLITFSSPLMFVMASLHSPTPPDTLWTTLKATMMLSMNLSRTMISPFAHS